MTQAQGIAAEPIDLMALDMWSSGVVLFQLLTGRLPFTAQDALGAIQLAPDHVQDPAQRQQWEFNATWQAQLSWVLACTPAVMCQSLFQGWSTHVATLDTHDTVPPPSFADILTNVA